MDKITNWISGFMGINPAVQNQIFSSILIIFILWLIRNITLRIVWKRTSDAQARYNWRKITGYTITVLGFLLVGRIWFAGIQSLATYLGLLSAGLAIALRDLVASIAGWAFILWRRPFTVGDRIQIGQYAGDVIDIRIFKFAILEIGNWVDADQSTGRIIDIPNSKVLSDAMANYTKGFEYIWNEIPVLITFESNWSRAKSILFDVAVKHAAHISKAAEERIKVASRRFLIFYTTLTPTVYTSVKDNGVLLTIRYMVEPRRRRSSVQAIWEDILQRFAECDDIDFAYPTRRLYNNVLEGKPGARAANLPDAEAGGD